MREITVKYDGTCRTCDAEIAAGERSLYERGIGLICLNCGEPDTETIRELRQDHANGKAERLDEWAGKRRAKAESLNKQNAPYYGDHAFCTQSGHIPERERVNRRDDKAYEHTRKAQEMESKADDLRRGVRVKGDAERERQAECDLIKPLLKVGMIVDTPWFNTVTIKRLNLKSVTIKTASGYTERVSYSWVSIPK